MRTHIHNRNWKRRYQRGKNNRACYFRSGGGGTLWLRYVAGVLGRNKKTVDREHFHSASFSVHNAWHFEQDDASIHRIIQSITFRILSPTGAPSWPCNIYITPLYISKGYSAAESLPRYNQTLTFKDMKKTAEVLNEI